MVYLDQNVHTLLFKQCAAFGIQNGYDALLSMIFAGRGLLVKMLITLEPHHVFCSKFALTTLEKFTYIPFACTRQIKITRPLHDPGTEY